MGLTTTPHSWRPRIDPHNLRAQHGVFVYCSLTQSSTVFLLSSNRMGGVSTVGRSESSIEISLSMAHTVDAPRRTAPPFGNNSGLIVCMCSNGSAHTRARRAAQPRPPGICSTGAARRVYSVRRQRNRILAAVTFGCLRTTSAIVVHVFSIVQEVISGKYKKFTLGDNCKSRWKSLRECYRKALLKRETKSGQAAKKLKPWRLKQQMDFVKQYVNVQREQESNISESIPELENSQVTKTPSLPGPEPESASNEPGSASATPVSASTAPVSASSEGFNNKEALLGKKPKTMTPTAAVFQEYVNLKKQQLNNKSLEVTRGDYLTKYFQGLQIREKSNISRIIHDAELEAISGSYNTAHSFLRADPTPTAPVPFQTTQYMPQLPTPIGQMGQYPGAQEERCAVSPDGSSNYSYTSNSAGSSDTTLHG
ncbi:hypothetical protein J6590_009536 [Homalodisca vitripennis]|nr:hypothetical protein J6590_009536 [Homalodisca vitripennis]